MGLHRPENGVSLGEHVTGTAGVLAETSKISPRQGKETLDINSTYGTIRPKAVIN